MDLQPIHQPDPSSSSSTSTQPHHITSATSASTESRTLRSSARVKAAKQKEQEKEREYADQSSSTSAQPDTIAPRNTRSHTTLAKSKRLRDTIHGKGKSKEIPEESSPRNSKRSRRSTLPSTSAPLTINEPVRDPKGKKRAAPEPSFDEESTSTKRPRTSYSLRPRPDSASSIPVEMPKKTRSSAAKGKMAMKNKALAASSSSRLEDEDIEMLDPEYHQDDSEPGTTVEPQIEDVEEPEEPDEDEEPTPVPVPISEDGPHSEIQPPPTETARPPASIDESAALAIFGDYRQFGSYMMSLSSRLKTMLNNIKPTADPTTRLVTLQELSEVLSISTEDTLAGSFQVEQFVRELVRILGGRGTTEEDEDGDDDDDRPEQDEDAALAAALAMSAGGSTFQGDDNLEAQVLACRCLANLMEALPGVAHTVVYHGAIPVLCSKLIEISYIDLAEQTLSTLEKISEEFPSSIVREGGLAALLNYLDFFSIAVQRTALQAASNCCRNVSSEHFAMIRSVWPIIRNCLSYSDQRLVEFACLCVIRVIDSYHRSSTENLEFLVDTDLIRAVNMLLFPAGGSPLIAANTYTLLLRALATSARASSKITIALLEADIVDTLYQILTGVLPSKAEEEQGLADMTVMDNLAHRPKDQVEEALSLISELMPPLPKDGVFDHKSYTEKSLARMVKARAKVERAASRNPNANVTQSAISSGAIAVGLSCSQDSQAPDSSSTESQTQEMDEALPSAAVHEVVPNRIDLLRSKAVVVGRFMQLMVPILVDVYAASVITPVRVKTLTGLLKAVSFLDGEGLKKVLTFVPIASFASSILSSKDHLSLVIGALQLVELLLNKLPTEYKPSFRREGVFHEIELLASKELTTAKPKDKDNSEGPSASDSSAAAPPHSSSATIPGFKKLSSLSLEPEDAITLRCRIIRFKYIALTDQPEGDSAYEGLRQIVERLSVHDASEKELADALKTLAELFASPHSSVSSFELLQSGVVDGLLQFATDPQRNVTVQKRGEILFDAFAPRRAKYLTGPQSPLSTLVKKLQESLTRMESFDVVTVAQSGDDSKRSSPSLLARQLRLRLVAGEDSDIPKNLHNIVVSIHAIATFQALHDYLRPRVAGLMLNGRLSGMLGTGPSAGSSREPIPTELNKVPTTENKKLPPPPAETVGRRRSLRLSAKHGGSDTANLATGTEEKPKAPATPEVAQTSASAIDLPIPERVTAVDPNLSDTVVDSDIQADFTDDEVEAEVFDEEPNPDASISEKTVSLSVAEDGSKVEAQTPDGTRVTTPNPLSSLTGRNALSTRTTYAAALKTKPTDWHLGFSMDDQPLPLDLTIYGAIHQHELRKKGGAMSPSMIWQGLYTVTFKKVAGPAPAAESRGDGVDGGSRSRPSSPMLSLPEDAPHAKILRLLRVLHRLNALEAEHSAFVREKRALPGSAFVNNKLSAKLTRQLEEPMIVASSCLPDWALDLPQHFPFLFPFATRYNFLQSTSFGYARLILKWQSQQTRGQDTSRRDDGIGFLGRLQRQKVRISRKHILESAVKVFELYGSSSSVLEVEYFDEAGTGLGPTLEFYSLVSKEFARRDLKLWRDTDQSHPGLYVHHPHGLFPAPLNPDDMTNDGGQKRTHIFRVIGQFVAKAMLDSRMIDLSLNKIFVKLVLGEEVPLTMSTLKLVDLELANSLTRLQGYVLVKEQNDKLSRKLTVVEHVSIEDLALDFTIPGYDIELRPGGRDIPVTLENVEEYIREILDAIIGNGAQLQAKAFRDGFSKVFPISDLQAFSADELVTLFGESDDDWSIETLGEALKADHGFNVESRAIRDLIEIMSEFDAPSRRAFLQFITGSPKLPIGGFRSLNPPLTVVRKPHEPPLVADDYLPSVMTCVNYLKLPDYSSKAVMRIKLCTAIQEGVGSFHLS